jgi:hypothetical protein
VSPLEKVQRHESLTVAKRLAEIFQHKVVGMKGMRPMAAGIEPAAYEVIEVSNTGQKRSSRGQDRSYLGQRVRDGQRADVK